MDLNKTELDTISFYISKAAHIKIQIWNGEGYLVRNLFDGKVVKGEHFQGWNGYDNYGEKVASGDYYFTIEADLGQQKRFYDPWLIGWGKPIEGEDFIANLADLRLYYRLPQPAMVRIRAGVLDEALLYNTIVNWQPRSGGPNVESWDGYDNSRLIDIAHNEKVKYSIEAYSLPENVIIVKNEEKSLRKEYSIQRELSIKNVAYRHAFHPRRECFDPEIIVTLPESLLTKEGIPVVHESLLVQVSIMEPALNFMENQRFEIMFFLDGKYYLEEEYGYSPYKHIFDLSNLTESKHALTAVLVSSEDHAGSTSIQFQYEKRRKKCCSKKS
jgi:hypothetical protein